MNTVQTGSAKNAQNSFTKAVTVLVLALATLIVFPPVYLRISELADNGYESLELACSVANGHGFSDPFLVMDTGPSAHVAPVFPALLAVLIKVAPSPSAAYFLMECAATAVVFLQLCLLPLISKRFGFGFVPGLLAAVLWIVAKVPKETLWEQNYSGVFICALALLMYSGFEGSFSWRKSIFGGLLWGVSILWCPVTVLALIVWIPLLLLARTQSLRQLATLVLLPVLVVSPWIVRNYSTFRQFVFVRDNLGIELEVSNNPCATFSFELNRMTGCYAQHHPNESTVEAAKVAALGEVAYNQQRLSVAKHWAKAHTNAFVGLTVERAVAFWFPSVIGAKLAAITDDSVHSARRDVIISAASLLAALGLMALWKRNRWSAVVFIIWLAAYPPIYYLTQYSERARTPILWAIFVPAGVGLTEFWRNVAKRREQR